MQVFCTNCGKALRADMKLCPYCGKLVGQQSRRSAPQRPQRPSAPVSRTADTRPQQTSAHRPHRTQQTHPTPKAPVRAKRQILPPHIMRIVYRVLTVLVVLVGIYTATYIVQVYRVKSAVYPFKTQMKLTYTSYGQAFDEYFDDGSWSVNPFNITCTYKGKSNHSEDYKIVFSAGVRIKVKSMTVDEKEIDKKIFEQKLLGMFI